MAITPLPLNTEFLFRMVLTAGAPQMETAAGARGGMLRVVPVTGGTFDTTSASPSASRPPTPSLPG